MVKNEMHPIRQGARRFAGWAEPRYRAMTGRTPQVPPEGDSKSFSHTMVFVPLSNDRHPIRTAWSNFVKAHRERGDPRLPPEVKAVLTGLYCLGVATGLQEFAEITNEQLKKAENNLHLHEKLAQKALRGFLRLSFAISMTNGSSWNWFGGNNSDNSESSGDGYKPGPLPEGTYVPEDPADIDQQSQWGTDGFPYQ